MTRTQTCSPGMRAFGVLMLFVGAAVFLVRLHHAGDYAFPRGGNLLGGALALFLGVFLVRDWLGGHAIGAPLRWLALAASPVVLFFALYATMAELEEVVVLKATDAAGQPVDLRLWIVEHEGASWVTMQAAKADAHALDGARLDLVRGGEARCVVAARHDERPTVDAVHQARHQKYFVQRIATAVGVFGQNAKPEVIALRFDACPAD